MTELRPCIVRISEQTETYREPNKIDVKTRVVRPAEEHKGYFHKWFDRFWTVGASLMVGGYSAGQMSETVAIVEYEDGTVHEHKPSEIQFIDKNEVTA